MSFGRMIELFINQEAPETDELKYDAGIIRETDNRFHIAYEQNGARSTFSIGQPVYDSNNNLMGFLGMGLYEHLDYSNSKNVRIPCERWDVLMPTKHCVDGTKVITYWQMINRTDMRGEEDGN